MNGKGPAGPAASDISETVDCCFHGVNYFLSVSTVKGDTLVVEVEDGSDASRWRGEFTSRYIEDITAKTGNFKKYPVFIKMLVTALKGQSEAVFIDLLTYSDLETLKSRRGGGGGQPLHQTIPPNNKRYLILTYAAEFDRVHYPLPLVYEENPDPHRLKEIIRNLRSELGALRAANGLNTNGVEMPEGDNHWPSGQLDEVQRLQEENNSLRRTLRTARKNAKQENMAANSLDKSSRDALRELRLVQKERDLLQSRAESSEAELERERGLHRRELRRKAKQIQELNNDLHQCKDQLREQRLKCRELMREVELAQPGGKLARYRSVYGGGLARSQPEFQRSSIAGRRSSGRSSHPGSSRGTCPSSSQGQSSGDELPPRRGRPRSAPGRNRFDPTEYVRNKRERQAAVAAEMRRRSPSFGSSARSSSAGSRSSSAERQWRSPRDSSDRGMMRQTPPKRAPQGGRSHTTNFGRAKLRSKPRGACGSSPSARSQKSNNQETSDAGIVDGRSTTNGYVPLDKRSASPGRALQDVKLMLSKYTRRAEDEGDGLIAPPNDGMHASTLDRLVTDTGSDIADVESRLNALQNFIRMARLSAGSESGEP